MDIDWNLQLIDQLDWHWQHHLRPRLDGLTDDEYLWEPVPGCWSLRPRDAATSPLAAGLGDVVADFEYPEPRPAPFTTIAWRMAHISIGVLAVRTTNHFGRPDSVSYPTTDWSLSAADGVALLDHWYDGWLTGLRSMDAAALARACGPTEGPYADHPFVALILHISREVIHHGSELCLMRDLYRSRTAAQSATPATPATHDQGASS